MLQRQGHSLGPGGRVELGEDVAHVELDRRATDDELVCHSMMRRHAGGGDGGLSPRRLRMDCVHGEACMTMHIRPMSSNDIEDVVHLSLLAWAPVFRSFEQVLGKVIYTSIYPDWQRQQADVV